MNQYPPNLILSGGCLLAFGAACANVGFLLETGISISHLTGDISRLAIQSFSMESLHGGAWMQVALAALGFLIGAVTAGFLVHHPVLEPERPYGWLVAGVGALLVTAWAVDEVSSSLSILVGASACGLQNALATRYRGLVLRTTHVTGLVTDMGVSFGMILRGHRIDLWKLGVPAALVICFFLGAAFGGLLVWRTGIAPALLVGSFYLFGGLIWSLFSRDRGN